MITIAIQIGNSDDKLSQREWSDFVTRVGSVIEGMGLDTHFFGVSYGAARWQNACWIVNLPERTDDILMEKLVKIRSEYYQDSIAYTVGRTKFI